VSGGEDQIVNVDTPTPLRGAANDDELPEGPGSVDVVWSQQSGPGRASFVDATVVDATVTFPAAGTYELRLTADDGELTAMDEVTVVVIDPARPPTLDLRIQTDEDDAEEVTLRDVMLEGSILELGVDGGGAQIVGLRFAGVGVPAGAAITRAELRFTAAQPSLVPSTLTITAEASDDATEFSPASRDLSARSGTSTAVSWSPPPWTTGESGPAQRTPDLSAVIQEIVDRPGWNSGNAIAVLITGSGQRHASAHDHDPALAPVLHVEYAA
jgi:hypothetical protein